MIIDVEQSCLSRVMFTVGRLVRVKKIVQTEVSSEPRFNKMLNYFRYKRNVRNGAANRELVIFQSNFLENVGYYSFFENRMKLARAKRCW